MIRLLFRSVKEGNLLFFYPYKILRISLLILFFITPSCKKDNGNPSHTNEITLSSQTFGTQPYYIMGYSFEYQDFYERISSGSEIDIYLNEILNTKGELTGVQFSTNTVSESTYGFYLNAEFLDLAGAEEFYNNYNQAAFPEFVTLTDTIKAFQMYTFRTWKANYVKFFVKEIRVYNEGDRAEYMEVDIKYFIQRDGTIYFSN